MIRNGIGIALVLLLALLLGGSLPARAQDADAQDALLITPTTQGRFMLPQTGVTLEIGYASVESTTRLIVTRQDASLHLAATSSGVPLDAFAAPLIVSVGDSTDSVVFVAGWPGDLLAPSRSTREMADRFRRAWRLRPPCRSRR